MRIGGIASGFDTEQIVKDLMRAERMPMDRLYQQKVRSELQRDAYREVNTMLRRLQEKAFDMRLQGSFTAFQASSSQEAVAAAAATGAARAGSFDLHVTELASGASFNTNTVDATAFDNWRPEAGETKVLRLRTDAEGEFTEITVTADDSLDDVWARMNRSRDLGLQVFFDEQSGVALRSRATGSQAVIEFGTSNADTASFLADVLNVGSTAEPWEGPLAEGSDAKLTVNGLDITRAANTFSLDGTSVTLHSTGTTTIQVQADVDAVQQRISDFVDLYNELITDIQERLNEPVHRDFPPLTNEQRQAMSDREIELWEEKAHSGMLRGDQMLTGILTNLRMAWSAPVEGGEGSATLLSQVGIATRSWHERGILHVDENKLKQALAEDPDGVMRLFTQTPSEEGATSQMGVARRLDLALRSGMERVTRTAGNPVHRFDQSFLGNEIRRFEERLDAMEERMQRVEQRYWRQFTTMERMLSDMYAQSDWLSQQLMGMMG